MQNLKSIAAIVLPIVLIVEVIEFIARIQSLSYGSNDLGNGLFVAFLGMVLYPVYTIALILFLDSALHQRSEPLLNFFSRGFRYWLPYVILTVLMTVAIFLA